jgi:hypothetical protein
MTKDFRNVPEIGPLLEHPTGKSVPEQMCCHLLWAINARLSHGTAHNMADARGTSQRHTRGVRTQEDPLRRPNAPVHMQVTGKRGSCLPRQWKKIPPASFATDQDFTGTPAYVAQFQREDFVGSETQFCQQKQDRQIAASSGSGSVRRMQDAINLPGCQLSGNIRLSPPADWWNRGGQIVGDLTLPVQKAQKGAEACGQQPHKRAGSAPGAIKQESPQHAGIQSAKLNAPLPPLQIIQQIGNQWQINAE